MQRENDEKFDKEKKLKRGGKLYLDFEDS